MKSVHVPILDINKCVKEDDNLYANGMNICAGELGKSSCQVRYKMQKLKKPPQSQIQNTVETPVAIPEIKY